MNAFVKTATEIAKKPQVEGFDGPISNAELNRFQRGSKGARMKPIAAS